MNPRGIHRRVPIEPDSIASVTNHVTLLCLGFTRQSYSLFGVARSINRVTTITGEATEKHAQPATSDSPWGEAEAKGKACRQRVLTTIILFMN